MRNNNTGKLALMGLLTAILILFSFTPIGTIPIGPLSITLNTIPIAIAAIAMGPAGGAAMGAVFGILSFLQCIGIGVPSAMGAMLFGINPFLAFIQRFIPRLLDGFLVGLIFKGTKKAAGSVPAGFVTGFFTAFLNTLFFMSALILLFGNTEYVQELIGGRNVIVFVCAFVGINAVFEMITTTILSGAIGAALHKARLLPFDKN
ncbi:MAG: ECF transporter S component [Lachnospiraceae bacterium]|nr:ECF transporter S component [Lachnospiraceae bacterium]MBR3166640.1 ECF transporter S component [Lachnospiraceae bacterium]